MIEFSLIAIAYCIIGLIFLALLQTLRKTLVRMGVGEEIAPSAALIASAVLAYPALFIYLVNPPAGVVYSVLIIAFALTGLRPKESPHFENGLISRLSGPHKGRTEGPKVPH